MPPGLAVVNQLVGNGVTILRFAALARVEGTAWTAYAVRDDLSLGVQPVRVRRGLAALHRGTPGFGYAGP